MDKLNCFSIIGISIVTTNENGQSLIDIEKLWDRFWSEDIQKQVPNKISEDIYAVYTDYENKDIGKYTVIIGLPVCNLNVIPEGFIGRELCIGESIKYTSKGKMPDAIVATWMDIWQDQELNRAFRVDVTVHGEKYYLRDDAEVETFISVT